MLEEIRRSLLSEARLSPQLLSDLAGLENYVAESYDSRSFIELLQNADDAASSNFLVKKFQQYLIIANNGHVFSKSDLEAICRSAASTKQRGNSIGYRGIGFKSVVGLAQEVHIISGKLEVTFSKKLTLTDVPQAAKVPLLRIPHPIDAAVRSETLDEIQRLMLQGYSTFFIFNGLVAESINNEFISFDQSSLLFLKNIRKLTLEGRRTDEFEISREVWDDTFLLSTLSSSSSISNWIVATENCVSVAFYQDPQTEKIEVLSESDAAVHAFLPTHEATGLGIKINGDISTDPSRTRVVFDQRTKDGIAQTAKLVARIIICILHDTPLPDSKGMLAALLPLDDPRLYKLQRRSFKSEFIFAIQAECEKFIPGFSLKPSWLNPTDFQKISETSGLIAAPKIISDVDGAANFMRYLGAKEAGLKDLSSSLQNTAITRNGCSEIVAELIRLCDTKQIEPIVIGTQWPIFIANGRSISIDQAKLKGLVIDTDFIDLVGERGTGASGLSRLIKAVAGSETSLKILPTIPVQNKPLEQSEKPGILQSIAAFPSANGKKPNALNLKKWRGAEEQLRNIFEAEGWTAIDVSRQNIGYDIECENNEGEKLFIEVKLIETPTQPFIMTSNEEAVARQKGDSYLVAIVKQSGDSIEVSFIPNPTKNLELVRQCRQWVWECSGYPYNPEIYDLQ
ncbi:DUF3883 domain-containing protein [Pseudomonas sp. RL_5y_Pfl2_73]|uniref:DUF3883 domain-containing protein n=1 Tax=Pseudomonas sp. RL_5y_Pfl2_73 TaxID=3088713 RepID=UPI0030DD8390